MKNRIKETVDRLDTFQPVFDLWVKTLRIDDIPYSRVRQAMIRENLAQFRLFEPRSRAKT
jgi:hypothetical protein